MKELERNLGHIPNHDEISEELNNLRKTNQALRELNNAQSERLNILNKQITELLNRVKTGSNAAS